MKKRYFFVRATICFTSTNNQSCSETFADIIPLKQKQGESDEIFFKNFKKNVTDRVKEEFLSDNKGCIDLEKDIEMYLRVVSKVD